MPRFETLYLSQKELEYLELERKYLARIEAVAERLNKFRNWRYEFIDAHNYRVPLSGSSAYNFLHNYLRGKTKVAEYEWVLYALEAFATKLETEVTND